MEKPETTIVVGYTPTPLGRAAVREAVAEAKRRKAFGGVFLHVVNTSRGDAYVDHNMAQPQQLAELDRWLHASRGAPPGHAARRPRRAGREILRAVEETGAGLVVIGLRRRTPVGKFLMGSTAQRILLEARCPVLAVTEGSVEEDQRSRGAPVTDWPTSDAW